MSNSTKVVGRSLLKQELEAVTAQRDEAVAYVQRLYGFARTLHSLVVENGHALVELRGMGDGIADEMTWDEIDIFNRKAAIIDAALDRIVFALGPDEKEENERQGEGSEDGTREVEV